MEYNAYLFGEMLKEKYPFFNDMQVHQQFALIQEEWPKCEMSNCFQESVGIGVGINKYLNFNNIQLKLQGISKDSIIKNLESLVHERLTKKDLNNKLKEIFGDSNASVSDTTADKCSDDTSDYNFMYNTPEGWPIYGYFDIYYLKTRVGNEYYITEVGYEFED